MHSVALMTAQITESAAITIPASIIATNGNGAAHGSRRAIPAHLLSRCLGFRGSFRSGRFHLFLQSLSGTFATRITRTVNANLLVAGNCYFLAANGAGSDSPILPLRLSLELNDKLFAVSGNTRRKAKPVLFGGVAKVALQFLRGVRAVDGWKFHRLSIAVLKNGDEWVVGELAFRLALAFDWRALLNARSERGKVECGSLGHCHSLFLVGWIHFTVS